MDCHISALFSSLAAVLIGPLQDLMIIIMQLQGRIRGCRGHTSPFFSE